MLFWRIAPYYIKAMFSKYNLSAKCVVTKIMFWKHDYHAKIEILMLKLMFLQHKILKELIFSTKKKKKTDFLKIFYHKVIFNNYNKILLFS